MLRLLGEGAPPEGSVTGVADEVLTEEALIGITGEQIETGREGAAPDVLTGVREGAAAEVLTGVAG